MTNIVEKLQDVLAWLERDGRDRSATDVRGVIKELQKMSTVWMPPPTPDEIMRKTSEWVARLYGIRITFTIQEENGNTSTTVIDRIGAPGTQNDQNSCS